jgi:hypothetical protein
MVDSNFMRMDSFLIYFGRDGDDQLLDLCDRSLCLEPMHLAFPMDALAYPSAPPIDLIFLLLVLLPFPA